MAALLSGESSHHGAPGGNHRVSQENPEEGGGRWYMSRKEIEEDSPSRRDGIDLRKETHLRKSYCTFLQDLGMRLKVPQVTIATAIVFCHRFFLRQSHAKNDKFTIATVCMFLAGKVEETPRPLKDVILVSYEIIHKKDAAKAQKIKQKEVYEQQKELILVGERIVLATLGFDLNVLHPYKPLVEAIKKFKVAQNALAQVAWNFVNDGLRTSLCLQFKPHHIAAGAIFLAGKFLKVKLPQDGWWQEFDVIPRQLEEVSNQMLELYEQNRMPPSQASDAEGTAGGSQRHSSKGPADEEPVSGYSSSHGVNLKAAASLKPPQSRLVPDPPNTENHSEPPRSTQMQNNDYRSSDTSSIPDSRGVNEPNEHELTPNKGNSGEFPNKSRLGIKAHSQDDHEGNSGRVETSDTVEMKDKYHGRNISSKDGIVGQSPQDATKKLDKEKLKAAFERRKARGDITRKIDPEDELERELENVEVPSGSDKSKLERKQNRSKQSNKPDNKNSLHVKHEVGDGHYQAPKGRSSSADDFVKHEVGDGHYQAPKGRSSSVDDFVKHEVGDGHYQAPKGRSSSVDDFDTVEEGELEALDDEDREYQSPKSNPRKRKPDSPLDKSPESGSQKPNNQAYAEDRNGVGRFGYSERDHKRHLQENHV